MQDLEIDAARALKAARRCALLHPIQADAVTTAWLRQQAGRGWQAAFNALDKLIISSDTELAAQQERKAREDRGVWIWGAYEGVMNLTGRLDVTDARLVDDRLSWFADLIGATSPRSRTRNSARRHWGSDRPVLRGRVDGGPWPG
ncbi:hypothetical protein G7085_03500 [Tessaracoccus sp. HDW20]|uniref:hypothetical protein n=1 Tax=Tessaracoccus coleopterorum TaxID=2714950 RepID=UPI0018D4CA7C|nr:hypothetical protein [Tessaracoccus coleopterorum]NHB84034.1 hypothetical protein [Tessaracoccus coleopterorum]